MPTFGTKKGVIQQIHYIQTMFEPPDLECYRSLLPNGFSLPERPLVYLYVLAFDRLAWPGKPCLEGTVALNAVYHGIEGFVVKTMPVTNWLARWRQYPLIECPWIIPRTDRESIRYP